MKKLGLILLIALVVIFVWDYFIFVYSNQSVVVSTPETSDTIRLDTLNEFHKRSFNNFGK